jgi:hypothetical protein
MERVEELEVATWWTTKSSSPNRTEFLVGYKKRPDEPYLVLTRSWLNPTVMCPEVSPSFEPKPSHAAKSTLSPVAFCELHPIGQSRSQVSETAAQYLLGKLSRHRHRDACGGAIIHPSPVSSMLSMDLPLWLAMLSPR